MTARESGWCLLTEFTQSESLRKHALPAPAGCLHHNGFPILSKDFAQGIGNLADGCIGFHGR